MSNGVINEARKRVAKGQQGAIKKLISEIANGSKAPARSKAPNRAKPAAQHKQVPPRPRGPAKPAAAAVAHAVAHANAEEAEERNFSRSCASLANGILNPIGGPTVRNPVFSNKPTAVARLHEQGELFFKADDDSANQLLNAKNSFIALYNDPRKMHREYVSFSTNTQYTWQFSDHAGEPTNFLPDYIAAGTAATPQQAFLAGGNPIHGEKLVAGIDPTGSGLQGLWHPKVGNGTATIQIVGGFLANITLNLTIWKRRNGVWSSEIVAVAVTGNPAAQVVDIWGVADFAHYTVAFNDQDTAEACRGCTMITTFSPTSGVATTVGQHMAPGFDDHKANVDSAAITAHSVLLSNTSKLVDKNGSWYAIQVAGTKELDEFIPADQSIDMSQIIGDMQNVAYDTADEGIHAPRIPPSAQDFVEVDCSGCDTIDDFFPPYPIDDTREYVIVVFSILSGEGRSFHKLHYSHIQFKTTDLWYQLGTGSVSVEMTNAVLRKIGTMGPNAQFTRNKNHITKIFKWIKSNVLPTAGAAAQALAPMFGAYGPAVRAAGMLSSTIGAM